MQSGHTDQTDLPDPKIIALMLARCACNNHSICDDELRPIGQQPPLPFYWQCADKHLQQGCALVIQPSPQSCLRRLGLLDNGLSLPGSLCVVFYILTHDHLSHAPVQALLSCSQQQQQQHRA